MPKLSKLFPRRQFIYSFSKVVHQLAPYIIGYSLGIRDQNLFIMALFFQMTTQFTTDRLFFWAQEQIVNGKT